jgi:hypothetical protein
MDHLTDVILTTAFRYQIQSTVSGQLFVQRHTDLISGAHLG